MPGKTQDILYDIRSAIEQIREERRPHQKLVLHPDSILQLRRAGFIEPVFVPPKPGETWRVLGMKVVSTDLVPPGVVLMVVDQDELGAPDEPVRPPRSRPEAKTV